jgi:ketosteroid isomerase-like protein
MMNDKTSFFEAPLPAIVGKDAIGKAFQFFLDHFNYELTAPITDVRVTGNLAVMRGTYKEKATPKAEGLSSESNSGNWMVSLERQENGSWQWDAFMATSDQPLPGMTADGTDEQALLQIERDFVTAAQKRDMAFFERTLAKEYVQVADGKPVNIAAQLAELKAGLVQIDSITMRDMRAHVFGDAALVFMEGESKVTYKGKPVAEKSRGVDFFVKRDGRWQVVYSQVTSLKP